MKLLLRCFDEYETFYCLVDLNEEFFKFIDWVREGLVAIDPAADISTKKPFEFSATFNSIEFIDWHPTIFEKVPDSLLPALEDLEDADTARVTQEVAWASDEEARVEIISLVMDEHGLGWKFRLKHADNDIGTAWLTNDVLEEIRHGKKTDDQ